MTNTAPFERQHLIIDADDTLWERCITLRACEQRNLGFTVGFLGWTRRRIHGVDDTCSYLADIIADALSIAEGQLGGAIA